MKDRLRTIRVENYRCFREPFELELRPLTFIYGWNNSGKSAATRLVKLLGDSLEEKARAPLDLDGGLTYRDLVWKPAVADPGPLRFALDWGNGEDSAEWRLDFDRALSRMYVRELRVGDTAFRAERPDGEDVYKPVDGGEPVRLHFRGLIPQGETEWTSELESRLTALRGSCHWLSGDRIQPPRWVAAGASPPREIDSQGGGATEILLSDERLLDEVSAWFARAPICRTLRAKEQEATSRLLLNPQRASFDVDLIDTGAGMGQVLPVLTSVARARAAVRSGVESIVAIEEPESQLHPNAQRALGEWFCEVAAEEPGPRLVLETHSRLLILSAQLAIARGQLDHRRVGVYWLDQREDGSTDWQQVEFDHHGRPGEGWPRDIFADESELGDELARLQFGAAKVLGRSGRKPTERGA